jgi:WD40 repeat protein
MSPDGQFLAVGGGTGEGEPWKKAPVYLVPAKGGEWQTIFQCVEHVQSIAFSPDRKYLAVGGPAWAEYSDACEGIPCVETPFDGTPFAVWDLAKGTVVVRLALGKGEEKAVNAVAFSPDGQWVAAGGRDKTGKAKKARGTIRLWRVRDWQLVKTLATQEEVTSLAFSPDGQLLASGGANKKIRLWNLETGRVVKELGQEADLEKRHVVANLSFSPDGEYLAACFREGLEPWPSGGQGKVWRLADGSLAKTLPCEDIELVGFSPQGMLLTGPFPIRFWRVPDFQQVRELLPQNLPWQQLEDYNEYMLDGFAVCWEKDLVAYSTNNGLSVFRFAPHELQWVQSFSWERAAITEIQFSTDGEYLGTATDTGVKVWRTSDGQLLWAKDFSSVFEWIGLRLEDGEFESVMIEREKRSWEEEEKTREEFLKKLAQLVEAERQGHDFDPPTIDVSPRNPDRYNLLIFRGRVDSWSGVHVVRGCSLKADLLRELSPHHQYLATGNYSDRSLKSFGNVAGLLWRSADCSFLLKIGDDVSRVAFSNDERWLAVGAGDGTVSLWALPEAREVRRLPAHRGRVEALALSADGKVLVSAGRDEALKSKVKLWRVEDGTLLSTFDVQLKESLDGVGLLGLSPDGQLLVWSTNYRNDVQVFRLRDGKPLTTLCVEGLAGPSCLEESEASWGDRVVSFAFSPDGACLALGGYYGSLSLWRLPRVE